MRRRPDERHGENDAVSEAHCGRICDDRRTRTSGPRTRIRFYAGGQSLQGPLPSKILDSYCSGSHYRAWGVFASEVMDLETRLGSRKSVRMTACCE